MGGSDPEPGLVRAPTTCPEKMSCLQESSVGVGGTMEPAAQGSNLTLTLSLGDFAQDI